MFTGQQWYIALAKTLYIHGYISICEPVWPSGKADGPQFDLLWLSFLFKNCGLWTLSCDFAHTINVTLKWLKKLPALMLIS